MALRLSPDLPPVLTSAQVAGIFRVNSKTVDRWARQRWLTGFRSPSDCWWFRREMVEQFLNQARHLGRPQIGGRP